MIYLYTIRIRKGEDGLYSCEVDGVIIVGERRRALTAFTTWIFGRG